MFGILKKKKPNWFQYSYTLSDGCSWTSQKDYQGMGMALKVAAEQSALRTQMTGMVHGLKVVEIEVYPTTLKV